MKKIYISVLAATVAGTMIVQAQDVPAAVQFKNAYELLSRADQERDAHNYTQSVNLYSEAQTLYGQLAHRYPNWQENVVRFRTAYCNDQIEAILKKISQQAMRRDENASAPPGPDAEESRQIQAIIEESRDLLRQNDHVKARMRLLQAISVDPDNSAVRLLLGIAQCQAGKYKDCIYLLEELVKEEPSNAEAYTVLGTAYFALGLSAKAKTRTEQALKVNGDLKSANFNMAQILLDLNPPDPENAMVYYKKAVSLGAKRSAVLEAKLR